MKIYRLALWILLFITMYAGQVHAKIFLKTITTNSLSGSTEIVAQAVGKDGSLYLVGRFQDGVRLNENLKLRGSGSYLAKQGSDGNWLWIKSLRGDAEKAELTCIDVSKDTIALGGVYHRSSKDQKIIWDDETPANRKVLDLLPHKRPHGFVMRLDLDGVYQGHNYIRGVEGRYQSEVGISVWDPYESEATSETKTVAIGGDGSITVGGIFSGDYRGIGYDKPWPAGEFDIDTIWFSGLQPFRLFPVSRMWYLNIPLSIFVARLNKSLAWEWAVTAREFERGKEGRGNSIGRLRVDSLGNTYFGGSGNFSRVYTTQSGTERVIDPGPAGDFFIGAITPNGVVSALNYGRHTAPSESAMIDLILTRDGGYFVGYGRVSGNTGILPERRTSAIKEIIPRNSASGSRKLRTWFAMVSRFSLQESNQLEIDRFAYLNDDTDNFGLSLSADHHNNIYVAGVAKEGVKYLYQDGQSEILTSELKVSTPGGRIIPFIVKLDSDLRYANQTFTPADPVQYRIPDIPFPLQHQLRNELLSFYADSKFSGPLDQGIFPDDLRKRFDDLRRRFIICDIQLSDNVTVLVQVEKSKWVIMDEETGQSFIVEREVYPGASRLRINSTRERYNKPSRLDFDSANQMFYWTGNFSNGKLVLGETNREVKTITLPPGVMGSFITALR